MPSLSSALPLNTPDHEPSHVMTRVLRLSLHRRLSSTSLRTSLRTFLRTFLRCHSTGTALAGACKERKQNVCYSHQSIGTNPPSHEDQAPSSADNLINASFRFIASRLDPLSPHFKNNVTDFLDRNGMVQPLSVKELHIRIRTSYVRKVRWSFTFRKQKSGKGPD